MTGKKTRTNDGLEILHRRYYEGKPNRLERLQEERENADVARKIYDLRKEAGLTQKELAERIGTTPSVISRLENADYEGHSFAMLRKIADALQMRIEICFSPVDAERRDLVDADLVEFFKEEGTDYPARINAVLRTYVKARTDHHA